MVKLEKYTFIPKVFTTTLAQEPAPLPSPSASSSSPFSSSSPRPPLSLLLPFAPPFAWANQHISQDCSVLYDHTVWMGIRFYHFVSNLSFSSSCFFCHTVNTSLMAISPCFSKTFSADKSSSLRKFWGGQALRYLTVFFSPCLLLRFLFLKNLTVHLRLVAPSGSVLFVIHSATARLGNCTTLNNLQNLPDFSKNHNFFKVFDNHPWI